MIWSTIWRQATNLKVYCSRKLQWYPIYYITFQSSYKPIEFETRGAKSEGSIFSKAWKGETLISNFCDGLDLTVSLFSNRTELDNLVVNFTFKPAFVSESFPEKFCSKLIMPGVGDNQKYMNLKLLTWFWKVLCCL